MIERALRIFREVRAVIDIEIDGRFGRDQRVIARIQINRDIQRIFRRLFDGDRSVFERLSAAVPAVKTRHDGRLRPGKIQRLIDVRIARIRRLSPRASGKRPFADPRRSAGQRIRALPVRRRQPGIAVVVRAPGQDDGLRLRIIGIVSGIDIRINRLGVVFRPARLSFRAEQHPAARPVGRGFPIGAVFRRGLHERRRRGHPFRLFGVQEESAEIGRRLADRRAALVRALGRCDLEFPRSFQKEGHIARADRHGRLSEQFFPVMIECTVRIFREVRAVIDVEIDG